ncbi:hypothetical protein V5O48_013111 [Marasmius crinis-equi]|uniref:Uncharacterized protein n=1 Tax=Marasmius crinis-equi TaxID=585013 RepID=A0ABR3F156_9AGAR
MRDYQIARGFDPTTADFARHCGLYDYVFEPVDPSLTTTPSRFEDLKDSDYIVSKHSKETMQETEAVYAFLSVLFGDDDTDTPEPASESSNPSLWSKLTSPLSWMTADDSEIPVMVF